MARVASLQGTLTLDSTQFEARLNSARRSMDTSATSIQRNLKVVDGGFSKLTGTTGQLGLGIASLARSIIPVIGVGGLLSMAKSAIDAAGGLGELAQQLGVSTDGLQALRYAAAQSGVEAGELDSALAKLTRSIGEAADGSKAQLDAFNALGVGVLDAQGKIRSTEAVLRDTSDALSKLQDPAARARIEVDLFGKSGQKLDTILAGGSGSLDQFTEAARAAGVVLDEETIAAADKLSDHMSALGTRVDALWTKFVTHLTPAASAFVEVANKLLDKGAELGDTTALDRALAKDKLDEATATLTEYEAILDRVAKGEASPLDAPTNDMLDEQRKKVEELRKAYSRLLEVGKTSGGHTNAPGGANTTPLVGIHNPPATGGAKAGKSDAEKEIDTAISKLKQLQAQVAEIGKTGFDLELTKALEGLNLQNPGVAALVENFRAAAGAIQADKDATEQLDAAWKAAQDTMAAFNKEQEEGRQITESLRTPAEVYADTLADLSGKMQQGAIDSETYNRGLLAAQDAFINTDETLSQVKDSFGDMGQAGLSALEDIVLEGGNAKDVLKGLLKDLARIAFRSAVGGIASSIFNVVGTAISSSLFHEGGIAGGSAPFRSLPAHAFAGAPRLHGGGFVGTGEIPAILKRGEGVFTPEQMAAMGGSSGDRVVNNTTVNVSVNGSGGTQSQNTDLADRTAKAVEQAVNDAVDKRISHHMRSGNMLRPGMSV